MVWTATMTTSVRLGRPSWLRILQGAYPKEGRYNFIHYAANRCGGLPCRVGNRDVKCCGQMGREQCTLQKHEAQGNSTQAGLVTARTIRVATAS